MNLNRDQIIKILQHEDVHSDIGLYGINYLLVHNAHLHEGMLAGKRVQYSIGGDMWDSLDHAGFKFFTHFKYRIAPEVEMVTYKITTTKDSKIIVDGEHEIEVVE